MCLAVPGKIVELFDAQQPFTAGLVEFAGVRRAVSLACVPEAREGDYVLVHAGVAITRIDAAEAAKVSEALEQLDLGEDFAEEPVAVSPKPALRGLRVMKFVDEYRSPEHCERLLREIRETATRPWTLMEVCGGQTHGLLRYGIDTALEGVVRLIHGPGCPVCVTPLEAIDSAIELARRPNITVTSFGDMLRVPGSRESLLQARADGGNVHIVYSPLDAVRFAERNPDRDVVFFAVGFETTAPATALAVHQAGQLGLTNFSLVVSHVRVQPAMEMLAASKDNSVQGFLGAGHVCTVAGFESYQEFVDKYRLPVVITGFEPVDLLSGILECVRQLERGEARVTNCYGRSVAAAGNRQALAIMDDVYEICDRPWRGLGVVPKGGFRLRAKRAQFDAEQRLPRGLTVVQESSECRSGEVLTGRIKPTECKHFGLRCTPDAPMGAPMVSTEGACAAYYRYSPSHNGKTVGAI